jgi:hypothetical protein
MAQKYDWKRRTELLLESVGNFLAYKMAVDGSNVAKLGICRRGVKLSLSWRRNARNQWTTFIISDPKCRDVHLELKHGHQMIFADWTHYKDDYKKLYKQLERVIYTHLVEEWAVEILVTADDRYHWNETCTKN